MKSKVPALGIAAAFVITSVGARLVSMALPQVHWEPVPGMHIHHYVYGIFILTIAGYLAMIFKGDRATSWIALFYGLGVGLTFDEFGMWLNPSFQRGVRWNTSGLQFIVFALALVGLIPVLFRRQSRPAIQRPDPLGMREDGVGIAMSDES
jgi:thiol:disulfide interchange protein